MAGSIGSEEGDLGFQIAPMVDVVFVLMLFFMANAGMQVVETEMSIKLPSGVGKVSDVPVTPIIVDINADGRILVNDQPYGEKGDKELKDLHDFFKNAVQQFGTGDPVIVRPQPQTTHERIMDVLNAAAAAHVTKLTFGG